MSARLLPLDGYEAVDPSHPLGGRDGGKDIRCKKDGTDYFVAVHFPRGQKDFTGTKRKFKEDLEAAKAKKAQGFVFFTNQELTLGERAELEEMATPCAVDIYHLERIASSLDAPRGYGLRLEFLSIEMTKEEQISFFNDRDQVLYEIRDRLAALTQKKEQSSGMATVFVERPNDPIFNTGIALASLGESKLVECKGCGEVFRAQRSAATLSIFSYGSLETVTCPACGKVQAYR